MTQRSVLFALSLVVLAGCPRPSSSSDGGAAAEGGAAASSASPASFDPVAIARAAFDNVAHRRVLCRVDFNVSTDKKTGEIKDDSRVVAELRGGLGVLAGLLRVGNENCRHATAYAGVQIQK